MAPKGRLQSVVDADDSDEDSSASGPPPLEDLDGDEGSVAAIESDDEPPNLEDESEPGSEQHSCSEDDDSPPPLQDEDTASAGESSDNDDDSDDPPEPSESDEIPALIGPSEDEGDDSDSDYTDDGNTSHTDSEDDGPPRLDGGSDVDDDDEMPPALDDPESDGDSTASDGDDDIPTLEMNSEDAADDDEEDDEEQEPSVPQLGLRGGFLNNTKPTNKMKHSSSYEGAGVGQREEGPRAAAERRRQTSQRTTPSQYQGAGAGARESVRPGPREPHPYHQHNKNRSADGPGGFTPDESADFMAHQMPGGSSAAAAAAAARQAQQQSRAQKEWVKQKKKKERPPEPPQNNEPAKPVEVVVDREAILARERELEEMRRRMQIARAEVNARPQPCGRCCLNRALADVAEKCLKHPEEALVWPSEKRHMLKCSAGCLLLCHQECWRHFQAGYEQETRGDKDFPHGINIIQALKVKDKTKPPLVHCVTPACPGYITALGIFEGPMGHETYKNHIFAPTQDQLKAIKEAQEADREAAKAAAAQARAERKAATDAAALDAWRQRLNKHGEANYKGPKGPKKPRNKPPKQQQQQLQLQANGAAAGTNRSGSVHDDLMQFLEREGSVTNKAAAAAGAEAKTAPAEAAAAAAAKPAGITIKNRAIRPIIVRKEVKKEEQQEDGGSPTAASVDGSASLSLSASLPVSSKEPDPLEQLTKSRHSDHVDKRYSSLQDMVEQSAAAAAAAATATEGVKKGKKKKGITLHVSELQTVVAAEDFRQGSSSSSSHPHRRDQQNLISPAAAAAGSSRQAKQQQQQQGLVYSDFPSLDQAAAMGAEVHVAERDYLMEALNKLKLGLGEANSTPHVLLECVDCYMIRRNEQDPKSDLQRLIKQKTGGDPVFIWLFEKQEAVAVTMANKETAYLVYLYLNNLQLHRKQLKPSYLRDAPYDDTLHRVCPEYETPAMQQEREMQEALKELGASGLQVQDSAVKELAAQVKANNISPEELMERLGQLEQQKQTQNKQEQQQQGKGKQQQKAKQQQQQAENAAAAASGAVAVQSASKALPIVPPARPQGNQPPAANPSQQQQQQQRAQPKMMYPQQQQQQQGVVVRPQLMPVMQQPFAVQQQQRMHGYAAAPLLPTVMQPQPFGVLHPVPLQPGLVMQPAAAAGVYVQQPTWQQQQQMLNPGAQPFAPVPQQGMLRSGSSSGQQAAAADGDWPGNGMLYTNYAASSQAYEPGTSASYWDSGQEVEVHDAQENEEQYEDEYELDDDNAQEGAEEDQYEEQEWQQQQQQTLEARLAGRGRSAAAAAAGDFSSSTSRSMSSSPGRKLNPLAKEFRIPGAGSTAPPSRLRSASSSMAGADSSSSAAAAAAASTGDASESKEAATAAADHPAAGAKQSDQPELAAAAAGKHEAAAGPGNSSNSSGGADEAAAAAASMSDSIQQQLASSSPAAAADVASSSSSSSCGADGLPADHVFDVVHLAGCTAMHLEQTFRNPNSAGFTLPHGNFTDSHKIVNSETGGLVMFNVDTNKVEGLWVAFNNAPEGVQWRSVATYKDIPPEVYMPVLKLQPFKNHYPGEQGMVIIKAIWKWAHPQAASASAVAPAPAVPAATAGQQQQQQPLGAVASARSSSGGGAEAATAPTQRQAVSAPNSRPSSTAAAAPTAAAPAAGGGGSSRALPPLLAMLANRPGSAGASGTSTPAAATAATTQAAGPAPQSAAAAAPAGVAAATQPQAAAVPAPAPRPRQAAAAPAAATQVPAAAATAPAAGAVTTRAPVRQQSGRKLCPMCGLNQSGWLVWECKHMGPCQQCCPKPADLADKFYRDPPEYRTCLFPDCGKPVRQLFRVVI